MFFISLWSHISNEFNLGLYLLFFSIVHLGVLPQNYLQWGASKLLRCSKLEWLFKCTLGKNVFQHVIQCLELSRYLIKVLN